jgi:hypothetical protein
MERPSAGGQLPGLQEHAGADEVFHLIAQTASETGGSGEVAGP